MKDILYVAARNEYGELVLAKNASKNSSYVCPECGEEMILRKSERLLRRPHFAHKKLVSNCTPESVLHYSFKQLLYQKILLNLRNQKEMQFQWKCSFCNEVHQGNLLKNAATVEVECDLQDCRPDLVLFDPSHKPIGAIEIIVSHEPTEKTSNYLASQNIHLIKINLKDETDLDKIDEDILQISEASFCRNPKCSKCNSYVEKKIMKIINSKCWKCKSPMKLAIIIIGSTFFSPDQFSEKDIQFARSKGVKISQKYSFTRKEKYYANTCPCCNAFIGSFYTHEYIYDGVKDQNEECDIGYFCLNCLEKELAEK